MSSQGMSSRSVACFVRTPSSLITYSGRSVLEKKREKNESYPGADPGFFLGGGALVSCSTSTPINHRICRIQVVLENRKSSGGEVCTPPAPSP